MEQSNITLTSEQVHYFTKDLDNIFSAELKETYSDINKYEFREFEWRVLQPRLQAILCTLNNDAYENIVKVVRDKLNLNDLFDNRQKYLN